MTPEGMLAEANRLVELQREERGYTKGKDLEGEPCLHLGPYVATPEREERARRIGYLRRQAACMESQK